MSSQEPQAAYIAPQDANQPRERRGRKRHLPFVPATVRLRGPGITPAPIQILDLSEDGIGLETSTLLAHERTLALDLDLSPEPNRSLPIRLIGQVAWSQSTGRAGVRFFSPDHAALQQIEQWLFLNAVASATGNARLPDLLPLVSEIAAAEASLQPGDAAEPELFLDEEINSSNPGVSPLSPLERDTNNIVSQALMLTGAKGAALALYEGGSLICRAICGTDTPALGARISTETGITGECVRLAQVMYCSDSAADPRVDRDVCADLGIRSILALPLFAGERIVGLLEVLSQRPAAFDPGDARALDLLARPVMGMLFAEGKSDKLYRNARDLSGEPRVAEQNPQELDLAAIEQRHRALARTIRSGKIYRRLLEGAAAMAVIGAVTWLVVWQTNTLAALKQPTTVVATSVATSIPSQAPHVEAASTTESLEALKTLAQGGDASAQYAVGVKYASGEGVPQDYAAAARWFALAARNGNAAAQGMLGAYYWSGRGVHKDLKQAYFWSILARDGKDEISKDRVDALVARLNRSEMLEVQQQLRDWYRKHAADSVGSPVATAR